MLRKVTFNLPARGSFDGQSGQSANRPTAARGCLSLICNLNAALRPIALILSATDVPITQWPAAVVLIEVETSSISKSGR
jgi:hypothetical protein